MTSSAELRPLLQGLNKKDFDILGLDDEIRVDRLCVDLLRHLFQDLTVEQGLSPEQAGELCHGADYFLREFIVADRRANLFHTAALHVCQFAGHWYIIRTPEPNLGELHNILAGTAEFFQLLARQGLVAADVATAIAAQCRELDYYQQRIDAFWAIEGDGYDAWRQACPLQPSTD
jgi:hypothetical protein